MRRLRRRGLPFALAVVLVASGCSGGEPEKFDAFAEDEGECAGMFVPDRVRELLGFAPGRDLTASRSDMWDVLKLGTECTISAGTRESRSSSDRWLWFEMGGFRTPVEGWKHLVPGQPTPLGPGLVGVASDVAVRLFLGPCRPGEPQGQASLTVMKAYGGPEDAPMPGNRARLVAALVSAVNAVRADMKCTEPGA